MKDHLMSMQTGEVRAPYERLTASEAIRRIEREAGADEFRQKNKEGGRQEKRPLTEEDETPHDVVELSGEYQAEESLPPLAMSSASALPAAPPERHIDIKV